MRRHPHHRAVPIAHQHVIAHPQRQLRAGERVLHQQTGGHAALFLRRQLGLGVAAREAFLDERRQRRLALGRVARQRVLGCHGAKRHAHEGVGAGGEHVQAAVLDRVAVVATNRVPKGKTQPLALADPVLLHQPHLVGPALQRRFGVIELHLLQQLLGVGRNVEVVARNLAPLHRRPGAPATAVDHLLVGQHGLVHRVPVHHLRLAVGDAALEHAQKQPLVPLVVVGRAGGNFAAPVDRQAQRLHLALHVGDVVVGPARRGHLVLDRRVFGRQPEGVPAHRHQHVVALHAQLAREHVVDGVVAHVAHVQLAAGVGQHRAGVVFGLAGVFVNAVGVGGAPVGLGRLLHGLGKVFFLHG